MCSHSANSRWLFPVELRIFLIWFFVSIFKIPFVFWIGLAGEKRGGHPPADGEAGEWGGGRLAPPLPQEQSEGAEQQERSGTATPPPAALADEWGGGCPAQTVRRDRAKEQNHRREAERPPPPTGGLYGRSAGGVDVRPDLTRGQKKGAKKAQAS